MANNTYLPGSNLLKQGFQAGSRCNQIYVDYAEDEDDAKVEDSSDIDDFCDADEKKELCPSDFLSAIKRFKGRLVTVEFASDGCVKKATGILKCIEKDFVLLVRPERKLVPVLMFCQSMKGPVVECACEVVIRFKEIISVERPANQNCPK
ncbi:MAG: hypothetical protein ACYC21_00425 [Eubacteriales bacterium]